MSRPKVFVSQDNDKDYSLAEEFGDVVFLSNREIVPFSASAVNQAVIHGIEATIAKDYVPGVDFLLPAGGMLSVAHMFHAAYAKVGDHRILKWDNRAQRYYTYDIRGGSYTQPA